MVLMAAGGMLAAFSVAQAYAEVVPYFASGIDDRQRFGAIVSRGFVPANSRWSRDLFLRDCIDVSGSIYALAQPPSMRRRFATVCLEVAGEIAASSPTDSSAWLVVATASADLGNVANMLRGLSMSKRSAPNIEWLADRRSRLAEAHFAALDVVAVRDYESDLAVLAMGRSGIAVLAQRYVRKPDLRETIARTVDGASPQQKETFLKLLRGGS